MRGIRNTAEMIREIQKVGSTLYKANKKSDIKQFLLTISDNTTL